MERPDFSIPVAGNGYAWWYVDALSDDGRFGLTVIAFVGSVFSPYYTWARRRAAPGMTVDPEQHVAINVALYRPGGKRWAMTERGAGALQRSRDYFRVGDSSWRWEDDGLTLELHELGAPWPRPLIGRVRVEPQWLEAGTFDLASGGAHRWQPFAPRARVCVRLREPRLGWSGHGYLDGNTGSEPLADAFDGWHWSRLAGPSHTGIVYDLYPHGGQPWTMALQASERHGLETISSAPRVALPSTLWGVRRRAPAGARILRTLEDTPFYARSEISGSVANASATGVHESLDAARLRSSWVQLLLPFRMPRNARPRTTSETPAR